MVGKTVQTSLSSEIPSKSCGCTKGIYFRVHLSVGMAIRLPVPVTAAAELQTQAKKGCLRIP